MDNNNDNKIVAKILFYSGLIIFLRFCETKFNLQGYLFGSYVLGIFMPLNKVYGIVTALAGYVATGVFMSLVVWSMMCYLYQGGKLLFNNKVAKGNLCWIR